MKNLVQSLYDLCEELPESSMRNILIVGDDLASDPKDFRKPGITHIHKNGRHIRIFFLNLVQYSKDYPPSLRNNVDYVFSWGSSSGEERKKLYEGFFNCLGDFEKFEQTFSTLTEDHMCIVLDKSKAGQTRDITKSVFWYKANINIPPFMLGGRTAWKLHYRFYSGRYPLPGFNRKMLEGVAPRIENPGIPQMELAIKYGLTGEKLREAIRRGGVPQKEKESKTLTRRTNLRAQLADQQGNPITQEQVARMTSVPMAKPTEKLMQTPMYPNGGSSGSGNAQNANPFMTRTLFDYNF